MSKSLALPQALDMSLSIANLDSYVQRVQQFPMLSEQEEYDLAQRWQQKGDIEAARSLVLSHLRFVVKIARGYSGYGLPQADLIQEGSIGLMKAVKRFDPEIGVRLVSFAVHWIKAEMHEYIIRNWRIVKIATTKAQRKLFFNLRKAKKRLGWSTRKEIHDIADELGVKPEEVVHMENRLNSQDTVFDPTALDDDEPKASVVSYLEDHSSDPAKLIEQDDQTHTGQQELSTALSALDDRSRDIIQQRWLAEKKTTLQDLSKKYEVSLERIRQIEQQAMLKMRSSISQ